MEKPQKPGRIKCSVDGCPNIEVIDQFDKVSYVAGMMDAEGSFSMNSNNSPGIDAYNNNASVLAMVTDVIGGNVCADHRGSLHLRIGNIDGVVKACEILIPKLINKKRQAELLLDACKLPNSMRDGINETIRGLNAKKQQIVPPPDTHATKVETSKIGSEWSYLAGYIDGDGTIVLQGQKYKGTFYFYPQLHLYSVRPEPLLWMQQRFGGQFESRKRADELQWMSSLSFEDQTYIGPLFKALLPHVVDKKEQVVLALQSLSKHSTERHFEADAVKKLNGKFRGLHKFTKNADGSYTDGKRSKDKPHKTHKGIAFDKDKDEDGSGDDPEASSALVVA